MGLPDPHSQITPQIQAFPRLETGPGAQFDQKIRDDAQPGLELGTTAGLDCTEIIRPNKTPLLACLIVSSTGRTSANPFGEA